MDTPLGLSEKDVAYWATAWPSHPGNSKMNRALDALKTACRQWEEEDEAERSMLVLEEESGDTPDVRWVEPLPTITIEALGGDEYIFTLRDVDGTIIHEETGSADTLNDMVDMITQPEVETTLEDVANTLEDLLGCGRNSETGAVWATAGDWDMVERAVSILRRTIEDGVVIEDIMGDE